MRPADSWKDYELLDATGGNRLERWGETILIRPDPQVVWKTEKQSPLWAKADAIYHRSNQGGGEWEYRRRLPEKWKISCGEGEDKLTLIVSPTGFKHTGVFPEQAVNWAWYARKIRAAGRPVKVLNLFGYTGGATLACAAAGAAVCHVDASKGIVAWGKDNAVASGLADRPIRWLVDDCAKFVAREKRRGNTYDGIITHIPFVKYVRRWNTENISALLHGVLRRNQCTASNRCLYHKSAHAQTGQHAVPQREICRCRRGSRQKLRQDQAVLGDFIFQVYMGFRIRHVQPAAHQGNAGLVRLQSTQIGGDVNTGGITRHWHKAHLHQIMTNGFLHPQTVLCRIASSHNSQQQVILQQGAVPLIKQQYRRIHNGQKLFGICRISIPENGQTQFFTAFQHFVYFSLTGLTNSPQSGLRQMQIGIRFRVQQDLHGFLRRMIAVQCLPDSRISCTEYHDQPQQAAYFFHITVLRSGLVPFSALPTE